MNWLKNKFIEQQFNPGWLGIFINPFYLVRHELYVAISKLGTKISGKTLDIGCGSKPYKQLFPNVSEYIGMDIDTTNDKVQKNIDVLYNGTVFPFKDAVFDSLVSTQTLEHVFNPDEFLMETFRVLKPKGYFLLTVPFVWDEHEQPYDYARYSSFGIQHLLKKNGFSIEESHKTLADCGTIFQLVNCYLYKRITFKNYRLRLFTYLFITAPITLIGITTRILLPNNNDLYMDNIILARKRQ